MTKITNPILPGFNADPSICRGLDEQGKTVYYVANSTFEWFPGVQIHRSYDLVNWELVSHPLDTVELLDMKGDPDSGGIWAPDLTYSDGLYWLIYTDVKVTEGNFKDCTNYLTTAPSVEGPWSPRIEMTNSGFDASLFHDRDGKKYLVNMYWDAREYKHPFAGIQLTEYSHEQKRLLPETSRIIYDGTNVKLVEGPHLYHLDTPKGTFYYLFAAQGGTTYSHQEVVARATSLTGEYETEPGGFEGEPFLTAFDKPFNYLQKCGHGSLVEVGGDAPTSNISSNEWYFAHLTGRPILNETQSEIDPRGYCPLGRETAIQKVTWDGEAWPEVVGGKQGAKEVEAPAGVNVQQVFDHSQHIAFDGTGKTKVGDKFIDINLQGLRQPLTDDIAKVENGKLTLFGRESLSSLHTQAHVARRWQSLNFDVTTAVTYNPTTHQQLAGLVAYYNTRHWTAIHITNAGSSMPGDKETRRVIEITKTDRGNQTSVLGGINQHIDIPASVDKVWFKLKTRGHNYSFAYSFDGQNFTDIPWSFESAHLSDDYTLETYGGFFTGAFTGLFNIDGTGLRIPAHFDFFDYQEL